MTSDNIAFLGCALWGRRACELTVQPLLPSFEHKVLIEESRVKEQNVGEGKMVADVGLDVGF